MRCGEISPYPFLAHWLPQIHYFNFIKLILLAKSLSKKSKLSVILTHLLPFKKPDLKQIWLFRNTKAIHSKTKLLDCGVYPEAAKV